MTATGRLVLHDPRSRAYEAPKAALKPTSWLHRLGPVLSQGQINGCTGWTAAAFLNSGLASRNRTRYNTAVHPAGLGAGRGKAFLNDSDARKLYEAATRNDDFGWVYPPTDKGSSGLGVAKALKALGVIDEYLWTFSFEQMLAWGQRQPVMLGTIWTEAMTDPDAKGVIRAGSVDQLNRARDAGMGHEYLLRGINWPRKMARIRNHWTDAWGIKGEALIPLADLELLVTGYRGDVCVPKVTT